jgi:glycosyltransferase involved in cell wall biosynthesis
MTSIVFTLFMIGLCGIAGMTFLFPTIGLLAFNRQTKKTPASEALVDNSKSTNSTTKIGIVIPAHNEEEIIRKTISSLLVAKDVALAKNLPFEMRVVVIADGCTDQTVNQCKSIEGVTVVERKEAQGKWHSLLEGVEHCSDVDWIAFVDSGSSWNEELLLQALPILSTPDAIGLSPSYLNIKASFLEQFSWLVERALKNFENRAGGPVSVHGATVMYRRAELSKALKLLEGKSWLNDDVVIPLAMRTLEPTKKIYYQPENIVNDISITKPTVEGRRRVRLTRGNLDWVEASFWRVPGLPKLLAFRRIARMAWSFWLLFLCTPLLLWGYLGVVIFFVLLAFVAKIPAFRVSLQLPSLLFSSKTVSWR